MKFSNKTKSVPTNNSPVNVPYDQVSNCGPEFRLEKLTYKAYVLIPTASGSVKEMASSENNV